MHVKFRGQIRTLAKSSAGLEVRESQDVREWGREERLCFSQGDQRKPFKKSPWDVRKPRGWFLGLSWQPAPQLFKVGVITPGGDNPQSSLLKSHSHQEGKEGVDQGLSSKLCSSPPSVSGRASYQVGSYLGQVLCAPIPQKTLGVYQYHLRDVTKPILV